MPAAALEAAAGMPAKQGAAAALEAAAGMPAEQDAAKQDEDAALEAADAQPAAHPVSWIFEAEAMGVGPKDFRVTCEKGGFVRHADDSTNKAYELLSKIIGGQFLVQEHGKDAKMVTCGHYVPVNLTPATPTNDPALSDTFGDDDDVDWEQVDATPPSASMSAKASETDAQKQNRLKRAKEKANKTALFAKAERDAAGRNLFRIMRDPDIDSDFKKDKQARFDLLKAEYDEAVQARKKVSIALARVNLRVSSLTKVTAALTSAKKRLDDVARSKVIPKEALESLARKIMFENN
jgi:hypothetical protein